MISTRDGRYKVLREAPDTALSDGTEAVVAPRRRSYTVTRSTLEYGRENTMRKWFAVVGLVLVGAGCSGISTTSDWDETYDFSTLATYAWTEQDLEGGVSEIMLRRMYAAVDEDLATKGFDKADVYTADVLFAYHTGTQDQQQYDTYGYGAGGWWGGYWGGGMTTTTVRTYSEGTLILDVVDREKNELIWRGSASSTIDEMASPEERVKTIQDAVAKLLKDFPPS